MKNNKIYIYVLGVLLVLSVCFIYINNKKQKKIQEFLKEEFTSQLTELTDKYNNISSENTELNDKLTNAKDSINFLKKRITKLEINASELRSLKKTLKLMQEQQKDLLKLADSLRAMNKILTEQRDQAEGALKIQTELSTKLSDKNKELKTSVDKASLLEIIDTKTEGVSISSSGKVEPTNRASSSNKIRCCFTIAKNKIAPKGNRDFFVRVLSPNNKLVTDLKSNNQFTAQDKTMDFSAKLSILYENEELDVCVFVGKKEELERGIYRIFIYTDDRLLQETELLLK